MYVTVGTLVREIKYFTDKTEFIGKNSNTITGVLVRTTGQGRQTHKDSTRGFGEEKPAPPTPGSQPPGLGAIKVRCLSCPVISAQANQESLLSMVTNLHVESLTSGAQNIAVIGDEGLSREDENEVTGVGPQPTGLGSL